MDLTQLANLGEFIGGVAVLVTFDSGDRYESESGNSVSQLASGSGPAS